MIFLGPPGAGKGTQATRLAKDFSLPYIATGDMLRAAVKEGSELGRAAREHMDAGRLVPDELILAMIAERLEAEETAHGFILDGFPRNAAQADALGETVDRSERRLAAVLLIEAPDDVLVRRISGRRVCVKNDHTYHVDTDPPKHEGMCDQDGSRLVQRDDDKPETVRARLETYHEQTEPLVDYYEQRGLLRRFDGTRTPADVGDRIRATVATLRFEEAL